MALNSHIGNAHGQAKRAAASASRGFRTAMPVARPAAGLAVVRGPISMLSSIRWYIRELHVCCNPRIYMHTMYVMCEVLCAQTHVYTTNVTFIVRYFALLDTLNSESAPSAAPSAHIRYAPQPSRPGGGCNLLHPSGCAFSGAQACCTDGVIELNRPCSEFEPPCSGSDMTASGDNNTDGDENGKC